MRPVPPFPLWVDLMPAFSRSALFFQLAIVVVSVLGLADSGRSEETKQSQQRRRGLELFEKKIRPVLIEHCYECHAADSDDIGGNLLVDSRAGLLAGGDSGTALKPGKPAASLLLQAIEYDGLEMPPDEKLPDDVAADFRRWISLGAPDPRKQKTNPAPQSEEPADPVELWSIEPLLQPAVPPVKSDWPSDEIDRFVYARMSENGILPNPDAPPEILLRRLYFDLTGLPPTPEQVERFVNDPSPERYAGIVDSLLASRAFAERWARHWLDIARYGESAGSSRDVLMLYAWRYRDYVIESFNDDVPFDRFVTEQIAGDLLEAETEDEAKRLKIATGLLAIGSKSLNGGNLTYDIIDDQIDVISKSVLALTVSCARCHDHKFDPIPTADYYSLAGIFLSTETRYGGSTKRPNDAKSRAKAYLSLEEPDPSVEAEREKLEKQFTTITKQVQASKKRVATLEKTIPVEFRGDDSGKDTESLDAKTRQRLRQYQSARKILSDRQKQLKEVTKQRGSFRQPEYAFGVQESNQITDAKILVRGEKGQAGPVAPRGFLSTIKLQCRPGSSEESSRVCQVEAIDKKQSGRRQLARWLTHPGNPLTPRVAVNRIWHHLMGQGIVPTVDNFGVNGIPPSHPELLDYLASRFVDQHGWSRKKLIRQIVLSHTYQLSSTHNADSYAKDPDNRLRWRMDRRRLEAEPLRDAVLAVSGLLRAEPLEGSLVMQIGEGEVGRNIDTSVLEQPFDHRSVYLPIIRGIVPEELKLFDFPEPSNVQGRRDSNTTSKQSLFFMNSSFVMRASEHFAEALLDDPSLSNDEQRVELAFRRCFGRPPSAAQLRRSMEFLRVMDGPEAGEDVRDGEPSAQEQWTVFCQSLLASAPFRFID